MRATVTPRIALRLLRTEHAEVADLIAALTDEEMTRGDTIRHGLYADQRCSFKDLLAHLVCYEAFTVSAIDDWKNGKQHWIIDAVKDPRPIPRHPLRRRLRARPHDSRRATGRVRHCQRRAGIRHRVAVRERLAQRADFLLAR